jgi:exonuclease SbcD
MKIAVTADLHLTSFEEHPERFHALENILDQLVEQEINTLIIAGDLFDVSCTTPGEFEEIVKQKKYSKIDIFIIPGNHDPVVVQGTFSLPNIHYLTTPQLVRLVDSIPFVFIPYKIGSSIGEILAENQFPVDSGNWVLVSHGDWLSGTFQKNQYEIGTYMPMSGRDILLYKPKKVFLGHIHAKTDSSIVHFPGSPCGMDPTETGYRTYLIFDTNTWQFERKVVDTEVIFFNEQITVLPLENEELYVSNLLSSMVERWGVHPTHISKIRLRVKVRSYSRDRDNLSNLIRVYFKDYQFTDQNQPDISQVRISNDFTQIKIAEMVKQKVDELVLNEKPEEADPDDVLLAAMNVIFGGK